MSRLAAPAVVAATLAGSHVGTPVQAADHFLCLSDLGTPSSPRPDGFADRIFWDDVQQRLIVEYLGPNGLDREDRSGQIVDIDIADGGTGYGRGTIEHSALTIQLVSAADLQPAFQMELFGETIRDDREHSALHKMWTLPLQVEESATEGSGLIASVILDGRAGVWSYYPVDHPWENPYLDSDRIGLSADDYDLQIIYPGSGYKVSPSLTRATQSRLRVALEGEGLGSLGFVPGGDSTRSRYIPFSNSPIEDTVREVEITGDILNPFAYRPGNWRNFLAHTPASAEPRTGWALPWAADAPGQIANLLISSDAMGVEVAEQSIGPMEDPDEIDESDIEALDESLQSLIDVDSTNDTVRVEVDTYSTEPTSGSGYKPGYFQIRDINGRRINGWKIRYETDANGGVYVNAKGSAISMVGNLTRERVGIQDAAVHQYGWTIEDNPAMGEDASGWTLHPIGGGQGFKCDGIQLFGSLLALPPISNRTDSDDGYDVLAAPSIHIGRAKGSGPVILPDRLPEFDMREPAQGRVVGSLIHEHGSGYYRLPSISLKDSSGTGLRMVPVPGDDGRRVIGGNQLQFETDLSSWRLFGDGDFNGDGHVDLLLHDPVSGNAFLINLGPHAAVLAQKSQLQATPLPSLNPSWQIGGIGRMGLKRSGCCILWRNNLTGQNVVWVVDSSSTDSSRWITEGSSFLPTVVDLDWSMICTNNAARNMGDRVYWIDPEEGSLAQWKIEIDSSEPSDEWLKSPDYLRDSNGDRIVGMKSSWEVVGAGSLAGHPRSDGSNAFRDLLLFDRQSGRSAIWLMDASGSQIDGSAPNGGAGFVTREGRVISGDIRTCRPVGIGHYAQQGVSWTSTDLGSTRTQWFPTIGWSLPEGGPWFTWKLDRDVDPLRMVGSELEGSGKSLRPFQVDILR